LVTDFFRRRADPGEPAVLRKARALAFVLREKRVRIHPRELLVGCFTSHRVGGGLLPELHGVAVLEDLFRFERRSVNPLRVDPQDRRRLLTEVIPYWAPRFLAARAMPPLRAARFVVEQLAATRYLINETGGISHFVPDYAALCEHGTDGLAAHARARRADFAPSSPQSSFLLAIELACEGLGAFAEGYRREAERAATIERDPARQAELARIAEVCAHVPRRPARTLHEALQSILFAQIALNLESLDNSVSPGRLDQILWPYFARDREAGALDDEGALELLGAFAVKLCEIVPVFSQRITRFHGGLFNGQVVVVGGRDREGADATNDLTMLWLELMDGLRTRQPNYHARVHRGSPPAYRARIARALAAGAVSPAVYGDERVEQALRGRGVSERDARDYANVGCVEPVAAGRSFF
ncbi:MAG: hypothetical protein K8H88_02840, partial [Sandaracinaceae bacterium]|nr:hypothetical protein [Sandaracinaceae bacterium]